MTFFKAKEFVYKFWADWSPETGKAFDKYPITAIEIKKRLVH